MAGRPSTLSTLHARTILADHQHGSHDRYHRSGFGQIFKAPTEEYLPFLAVGLILWGFISTALTEGCTNFIQADAIIKQLPIPLIVHVLRPIWRNVIILAHNFAIFPIVLFVMDRPVTETIWLALPGFLLLLLNLTWLSTALGVVCARYRDIPQIIASLMQVVFYLTPIMWLPNLLPERAGMYMLTFNPFFHLIEIVRAPLLGQLPSTQGGWQHAAWPYSAGL